MNKKGKFTDGGAIVWGFVPLRDLELMDMGEEQPEIMKKLIGTWSFDAGGSFGPDVISFAEDGTYTSNLVDRVHDLKGKELDSYNISGTWKVIAYRPRWNLFWDEPEYALLCVGNHGRVSLNGLSFDGEGYGLTGGEGGGGYVPADPELLENPDYVGYNEFDANG